MTDNQRLERYLRESERAYAERLSSDPKTMLSYSPCQRSGNISRKPMASASELSEPIPEDCVEIACGTCNGSGWDPGGLDPFGELCPDCKGSKVELVPLKKIINQQIPVRDKEVA